VRRAAAADVRRLGNPRKQVRAFVRALFAICPERPAARLDAREYLHAHSMRAVLDLVYGGLCARCCAGHATRALLASLHSKRFSISPTESTLDNVAEPKDESKIGIKEIEMNLWMLRNGRDSTSPCPVVVQRHAVDEKPRRENSEVEEGDSGERRGKCLGPRATEDGINLGENLFPLVLRDRLVRDRSAATQRKI
jgi:hypothetical protein